MKRELSIICLTLLWVAHSVSGVRAQSDHEPIQKLMEAQEFVEALQQIESIAGHDDPQLSYWHGICLAATGQREQAIEQLERVRDRWPETVFGKDSNQLTSCLEHLDSNSEKIVEAFQAAFANLANDHQVLSLNIQSTRVDHRFEAQFGIDFEREHCILQINQDEQIRYAFESSDTGSQWFIHGVSCDADGDEEPKESICVFEQSLFPVMSFNLKQNDDDKFVFNMGASFSANPKATEATLNQMLSTRWFATRDGIHEMIVEHSLGRGSFPWSVETSNEKMIVTWIRPDYQSGGFSETRFEFEKERLVLAVYDDWVIKLDTTADQLAEVTWPDVETVETELDLAFISRFIKSVSKLTDAEKRDSIAREPAETRIR